MLDKTYNAIKTYLSENLDEALDLAKQMDSKDDSFEWARVWDWEELCAIAALNGKEAVDDLVRAAVYGETYGGQVRYNEFGNLEPGENSILLMDAANYLTDIIDMLENYIEDDGNIKHLIISEEFENIVKHSIEQIN